MLDITVIRENPDLVRAAAAAKNEKVDIDAVLAADARRREELTGLEALRAERNRASEEIGRRKKAGEDADEAIAAMRALKEKEAALEAEVREAEEALERLLLTIPNIPADEVPDGGPENNEEVRTWGEPREFTFEPKPHWEIGEALGAIDLPRAGKLAGSGFSLLRGNGALLERALINLMLDCHTREHGFVEIAPPALSRRDCMIGSGQIPKLEEDMYRLEQDDLFLIPTAEVPVTNLHREEILPAAALPLCYTAFTPCFRREAGAYGKDTRGMIRVHQFSKVELVKFVAPRSSYDELESLLANAEVICQRLGLHYRVVLLARGDMSFASAKTYDIEVWSPGVGRFLEVSSCSNFEDFQARRAMIRFRDADRKVRFVHTLNGSGLALPRIVVAILETFQEEDGSVVVPEALRPYMHGIERLEPEAE